MLALHNTVPCFPTNTPSGPRLMATWWCPGGGGRRERKAPKELALGSQQPAAPVCRPPPSKQPAIWPCAPLPPTPPVGAGPGAGAGAGAEPDLEAREHRDRALRGSRGDLAACLRTRQAGATAARDGEAGRAAPRQPGPHRANGDPRDTASHQVGSQALEPGCLGLSLGSATQGPRASHSTPLGLSFLTCEVSIS